MLTGKTRYRQNWRGKMILQVEYIKTIDTDGGYGMGTGDRESFPVWRDATWEDI